MRTTQLYIGTDQIELFGDESISITDSIRNAKDISKVFTTFSKQFSVPASKNNNKIFRHYYNYDITNGFDARLRQEAELQINHLPFKKGRLKLDGVDMRNNKPYAYRVTFFGSVVELKDILGEDKLPTLTVGAGSLDIDFDYSTTGLLNNLKTLHSTKSSGGTVTGVSLPLITHSQRLYYDSAENSEFSGNLYYGTVVQGVKYNQLKYAVRLDKIIAAIESKYTVANGYATDVVFASDSFFKDATKDVSKLYMWCHRKNGSLTIEAGSNTTVGFDDEQWQPASVLFAETISNKFVVREDRTFSTITLFQGATPTSIYDIVVKKNGEIVKSYIRQTGSIRLDGKIFTATNAGDVAQTDTTFRPDDEFEVIYRLYEQDVEFSLLAWEYDRESGGGSFEFSSTIEGVELDSDFKFNIGENLPEIKVIDFLSSLFRMFNLVAYVEDNGQIQVQPLDDFYTTTTYDITKHIDVEKSEVNVALPFKDIFFKYKDTKTILAEQHFQEIADPPVEWGGEEYTDIKNIEGTTYKVEPDFHHAKYEKILDAATGASTGIQWGYFVNDNEEAYVGSPLLMYINNLSASVDFSFVANEERVLVQTVSSINMPSNTEDITDETTNNIHFGVEKSEYTNLDAEETLFKRFYQNYIENIFKTTNRIIRVNAILPISLILNISLSDIVVIADRKYRINSMDIDVSTGKTKLELINHYD